MEIEIVTKKDVLSMLEIYTDNGLMRRETAANYLDMPLSTFDEFTRQNPHLKKYNGKRVRYCPKELKKAFQSAI